MTTKQDTISQEIDEFDAWIAEQGQPATKLVEGFEVVTATAPREPGPVHVGDFFYSSWGYDQTNVDYYEVVGVSPSGKTIKVQECRTEIASATENGSSVRVVPVAGSVWGTDGVQAKRLRMHGRPSFFVASYADAYLWDGAPKSQTGRGWGH